MKKLFITSALLLSAFAFSTLQAKQSKVAEAEGTYTKVDYCRYRAISQAASDGYAYGSEDFQYAYYDYFHDCMN